MRMSMQEFRKEYAYAITMVYVKKMLRRRIISFPEYWRTNRRMKVKYKPISDGLISESDLLYRKRRANMGRRKEAGNVENQKT